MVAANVDSRYGGVSAVLGPLSAAIQQGGAFRVSIAAFTEIDEDISPLCSFAPVTRYPLRGFRALFSGAPRAVTGETLAAQIERADLVHIHGIWQEHCTLAATLSRRFRKPYVISAHGMLDSWALNEKKWKKSVYLRLFERRNLAGAAALHALTRAEAADYGRIAPNAAIRTIPNAIHLPGEADPNLFLSSYKEVEGKTIVLFLSRLHPKKGLDLLCEAWSRIAPEYPAAHLVVAGPNSGCVRQELESAFEARNVSGSVTFTGMLAGTMKWSALAAAHLFVLPSRSEGLSMAALEAMGMGKPVVLTEQCHIDGLAEQNCGWQIRPDAHELERAIRDFLQSPEQARAIGRNAGKLVRTQYSWDVVGKGMQVFYKSLVCAQSTRFQPV